MPLGEWEAELRGQPFTWDSWPLPPPAQLWPLPGAGTGHPGLLSPASQGWGYFSFPEVPNDTSLVRFSGKILAAIEGHLPSTSLCVCVCAQSCLTLCNPMDYSPPGSSVHGIFQARILEWVAISFSRRSSLPRDRTLVSCLSCIGRWVLYQLRHQGSPSTSL